jgi:endoplasmic reticulum-Golgi intermediate compartment protein 2
MARREHSEALSAPQAIRQSRQSRGFFSNLFASAPPAHRPLYKHTSDENACRISGTMSVKKMTGVSLTLNGIGHG